MREFSNLLVLAAMAEEEAALRAALSALRSAAREHGTRVRVASAVYDLPGNRRIHLARSGMGPVNAALSVATVIECEPIDAVVLLGVGGAISPELAIGELVVSREVLQHDSLSSLDSGDHRMCAGELVLSAAEAQAHSPLIQADPRLVSWISGFSGVRVGTIVSGSEFVGTVKRKRELQALHPEALLVDMEAAGIAQVCARVGLPFVVAKTVADRMCPDGSIESDFRACLESAAANAAKVVDLVLNQPVTSR